jgi:hypothetical protein
MAVRIIDRSASIQATLVAGLSLLLLVLVLR